MEDETQDISANTTQEIMAKTPGSVNVPKPRNVVAISFSLWWIVGVLSLVILAMLALWRPWQGSSAADSRKVTVSGSSTIKATPDEYSFNPSWEFKGTDKATTLKEATDKSTSVVAELKKLGVADKDIKTNAGGWSGYYYYNSTQNEHTYTLTVNVIVGARDLAQKVQDYLTTTEPTGQVTPQATFSTALQKKLEQQGRSEATKDARAKADEMAKNLGFKVGKVISITDDGQDGGVYPMLSQGSALEGSAIKVATASPTLAVQPGQNELTYSVQVVYAIR